MTEPSISLRELKEEFLECPICTFEYDGNIHVPMQLRCSHTFCRDCLRKQCSRQSLTCPFCNLEIKVHKNDINKLDMDRTRNSLLDLMKEKEREQQCSSCTETFSKLYRCHTCNSILCWHCGHTHISKNPNHSLDVTHSSSQTDQTEISKCKADGHGNKKVKYFCRHINCMVPLCSACVISRHMGSGHDIVTVEQWAEERISQMKSLLYLTELRIRIAKDIKLNMTDQLHGMAQRHNDLHMKMKRPFLEWQLRMWVEIGNAINSNMFDYEEHLENSIDQTNAFIQNAEECCRIFRSTIEMPPLNFYESERILTRKMEDFCQYQITNSEPKEKAFKRIEYRIKIYNLKVTLAQWIQPSRRIQIQRVNRDVRPWNFKEKG